MAIILAEDFKNLPDYYVKEQLDEIGEYWADLIVTGIKDGKKPEILIDRSGSMTMDVMRGVNRMDLARGVIESLAQKLREKAPEKYIKLYDSIPVKSWGSEVHEEHFVSPKQRGDYSEEQSPPIRKKTTLTDFLQNPIVPSPLPQIPCTDGTDHSLWLNESTFPLVITDDLYKVEREFVENYRNFDWCDGNNIVAIGTYSEKPRLRRVNQKIRNAAMGYDAINTRDFFGKE